jgi:hypothetical protein
MTKQPAKKRFAVGARVRVVMPGITGIVAQVDDKPTTLAEYWHGIKTEHGERREPGSNLELIPKAIGDEEKLNQESEAWKDSPERTAKGGVPIRGSAPTRENPHQLPSATTGHLNSDKK